MIFAKFALLNNMFLPQKMFYSILTHVLQLIVLFPNIKGTESEDSSLSIDNEYEIDLFVPLSSRTVPYKYNETRCYDIYALCKLISMSSGWKIGSKVEYLKVNQIIVDKDGAILDTVELYVTREKYDTRRSSRVRKICIPICVTSGMIIEVITKLCEDSFLTSRYFLFYEDDPLETGIKYVRCSSDEFSYIIAKYNIELPSQDVLKKCKWRSKNLMRFWSIFSWFGIKSIHTGETLLFWSPYLSAFCCLSLFIYFFVYWIVSIN